MGGYKGNKDSTDVCYSVVSNRCEKEIVAYVPSILRQSRQCQCRSEGGWQMASLFRSGR